MAISRIKYGGVRGKALNYSEFLCDGIEDIENLPTSKTKTDDFPTCAIGSRAFVGNDTYMLFPSEEWKPTKLVVCDCGCIHGLDSESGNDEEETTTDEPTVEELSEDLDAALSTIAAIIEGDITEIEDTKVDGVIRPVLSNCHSLVSVSFTNATSVAELGLATCTALESVDLPSVTEIGNTAFAECTLLTTVNLPLCTTIGDAAFTECSSLATLKLPSATTIGEDAFSGCDLLTDLYLPGTEASYTNTPFGLDTESCTIHYEYDFSADEATDEQEQSGNGG